MGGGLTDGSDECPAQLYSTLTFLLAWACLGNPGTCRCDPPGAVTAVRLARWVNPSKIHKASSDPIFLLVSIYPFSIWPNRIHKAF